jgi:hypothetical protein
MADNVFGPVSPETLAAFDAARAEVENDVLVRCLAEDAPEQTMGPYAEAMIKSGLGFVSRMLRAAMSFSAGEILADEMEWGKTRLPEYGVSISMVLRNFERYSRILSEKLPAEAFGEIRPYVESMIAGQRGIMDGIMKVSL